MMWVLSNIPMFASLLQNNATITRFEPYQAILKGLDSNNQSLYGNHIM